jgi:hypothetical protein
VIFGERHPHCDHAPADYVCFEALPVRFFYISLDTLSPNTRRVGKSDEVRSITLYITARFSEN